MNNTKAAPAYAHGVTHTRPVQAAGTHFNAANQPELEPGDLTQQDLAEIDEEFRIRGDLQRNQHKAERFHRDNDARAFRLQLRAGMQDIPG